MGWPVVIAANGRGIPVTESPNGTPYEIATNGYGTPVVFVDKGGLPVSSVLPVWAAGASQAWDFTAGRYYNSAAVPTDTHGQTINADDAAGAYSAFAPNVLVRTSRGLQTSPTRTNGIRNNSMMGAVAGSPGTPPTNWTVASTTNNLVRQIVGVGTDAETGLPYIDLRFSGTPNATATGNIQAEGTTNVALQNQTWTHSAYVSLVGGSFAGLASLTLRMAQYNSTPGYITEIKDGGGATIATDLAGATEARTRYALTGIANNASVAYVIPYIQFGYTVGVPVDFTLRIAAPQLELGAFASPPIITTGAAATVAGNQQVIASIPAPTTEAGLAVINLRGSADTNVLWSRNDGTANEWIGLIRDGANLDFRIIDGGATVADLNLGTLPVGRFGFAYTVGAGYARAQIVSGATVAALAPATFPTVTQWAVGDGYAVARNAYLNIERMAQAYGVVANDAMFAAWLARAASALAAA